MRFYKKKLDNFYQFKAKISNKEKSSLKDFESKIFSSDNRENNNVLISRFNNYSLFF